MTREIRQAEVLEVREEDGKHTAELRIVSYNVVDTYNTSWKPGVFTRSVEGGQMPAVFGHDPHRPIGVVNNFRDDGNHLDGTLEFLSFDAVPDARMAHEAMKRGAYPGVSFAFERQADEEDAEHRGATLITDADMIEVSPVLRASVPGSRVLAVRSDESIPVSEAADLLAAFAAGTIDLSDALSQLKGTRSLRVFTPEGMKVESPVEQPNAEDELITERLTSLAKKKR